MDLHGIASGAIQTINPFEEVTLKVSTGFTQSPNGGQIPAYSTTTKNADLQPLQGKDLRQVESLNLQGTMLKAYFWGNVAAIVRMLNKGSDMVVRADGTKWKVTCVFEQWPDWCAVCLTLQDGS